MLVLSRKSDQSVVVGGARGFKHFVKVTVLEIRSGQVKLGFEADERVPVHRWEVWERIGHGSNPKRTTRVTEASQVELDRWANDGGGSNRPS